jgi:hypothetical protein
VGDEDSAAIRVAVLPGGGGGQPDAKPFLDASLAAPGRFSAAEGERVIATVALGPFEGPLAILPRMGRQPAPVRRPNTCSRSPDAQVPQS